MTASSSDEFPYDEPDQVRDQVRQLLRHRLVIATGLVLGVCGAALLHEAGGGAYEADGSVLVRGITSTAFDTSGGAGSQVVMQTEVEVAGSAVVADRAAAALKEPGVDGAALDKGLAVSVSPDSQVLRFAYTGDAPAEAARRANALMTAYLAERRADAATVLDRATSALQAQLKTLNGRYTAAGADQRPSIAAQIGAVQGKLADYQAVDTTGGRVIEPATAPDTPAGIGAPLMLAVGGTAGLGLGILLAWLVAVLDEGVRDARDVRRHLGAPVLGTLPARARLRRRTALLAVGGRPSRLAEGYRALALRVAFTLDREGGTEPGRRVLLVVEPRTEGHAGEVAVNLAAAFAENGEDVLLIEADLRDPRLADQLAREVTGEGTDGRGRPLPPLRVASGRPEAFFLVPGRRTRGLTKALAEIEANAQPHRTGRTIVVSAPAVLDYPDALAVARWADGVLVALPGGGLRRADLDQVKDFFGTGDTPVMGAVVRETGGNRTLRLARQRARSDRRMRETEPEPEPARRLPEVQPWGARPTPGATWTGPAQVTGPDRQHVPDRTLAPYRFPAEQSGE